MAFLIFGVRLNGIYINFSVTKNWKEWQQFLNGISFVCTIPSIEKNKKK
nr:hypothetical protein [Flavihumibacter rivuli]